MHTNGSDPEWGFAPHRELGYCFSDIAADPENKVIIFTSSGDTFIDKEDLSSGGGDGIDAATWAAHVIPDAKRLLMNLFEIQAPMIAAVNGPATVHAKLALLCDIVLAADHATFQDAPHFPSGLVPGDGVHIILPMLLRLNRARGGRRSLIHRWKPWERSTEPKTPNGKAKVARNTYKGGWRKQLRELKKVFREQAQRLSVL